MEANVVGQPGFFDLGDRYAALSVAGDPLERLSSVVDFELFRGPSTALSYHPPGAPHNHYLMIIIMITRIIA